jgi:siroheme synthase-like protein
VPATFAYPIFLDVSTRPIVIVGGGVVAARKARALLDAGATSVTCVSPAFHRDLPAGVTRVTAEYDEQHLANAGLVFAATNSTSVNDAVVRDARDRGLLVNRADDPDEADTAGDFVTAATHRNGAITLAVSAGGNPALAAGVRDELAEKLDPRWAGLNDAVGTMRKELATMPDRAIVLRKLASRAALEIHAANGIDGLRAWLAVNEKEARITSPISQSTDTR